MAGPWEKYQEQPQAAVPDTMKAKPWEKFQYQPTQPQSPSDEEVIWDSQRSSVFKAPRGTAEFFATVTRDDTFDDQPDSTALEELGAGLEAQAAFLGLTAVAVGAKQLDQGMIEMISERKRALASAQQRQPEYMKKFYDDFNKADGIFSAAGVIVDNLPAVGRVTLTQSANAFMPLVAGGSLAFTGSLVGPVGTAAGGATGAFVGGSAVEVGAELDSLLLERGYDTSKAADLVRLAQDKETLDALREKALAKGLTTAAVDAVFTVVTGGVFKALKPVTKVGKVGKAAAGLTTETIGEGVGEGAGQLAAYGEMNSKDVLLEMVSSMGQSAGQATIAGTVSGASATAQKAKSVVFKAEQVSQKMESAQSAVEMADALSELNSVEQELNQAYEAAMYERGEPTAQPRRMAMEAGKAPEITQELPDIEFADGVDIQEVAQPAVAEMPKRPSYLKEFARDFGVGIEKTVAPISTRIKNISPQLFARMRRYEFDVKKTVTDDTAGILPLLQKMKALPRDARAALDLSMKNRNEEGINKIAEQYGMQEEIAAARPVLDNIFNRAQEAGIEMNYLENHFPRRIKDLDGLMDYLREQDGYWSVIREALKAKEDALGGRPLTEQEKATVIDNLLLGRKVEGISLAKKGVFKERTIQEIDAELNQFYAETDEALLYYIHTANEAIETNKLFGRGATNEGFQVDYKKSIGAMVAEMVDNNEISNRDARLLKDMLKARFNPGRMSKAMGAVRDISYIDVMGSLLNAITQFGDLAVSMYNAGIMRTAMTLPKSITDKTKISLRDINIEDIAVEFDNNGWTSRQVDNVFKLTGLQKIDRIGKLTLVNSTLEKQIALAKKGDKKLMQDLQMYFGDNAEQVRQDLANENITDKVKFLAFNTLLDMQPVARMEMPEYYLRSGNGKIFYMLKSFTIKQLDIYRREAFQKINQGMKTGNKKQVVEGMKNFALLSAYWITMGASADWIKDYVRSFFEGDEMEEPEDYLIENIYKAYGFSKYQMDLLGRSGPVDVVGNIILPPAKLVENMIKDAKKIEKDGLSLENSRMVRSVPVGGELYWFWFGGGSSDNNQDNRGRRERGRQERGRQERGRQER